MQAKASVRLIPILAFTCACGGRAATSADEHAEGGFGGTLDTTGVSGAGGAFQAGASNAGQAGADWSACDAQASCVIEAIGPCGPGCEPIPLSRLIAINSANVTAYEKSKPPVPCISGDCEVLPPEQVQYPNYYAECVSGECQVLDVRTTNLSACASVAECRLRSGTSCCGCGSTDLVAVSISAAVEQAFCAPAAGCASDCVSAPPTTTGITCTAGHCLAVFASGGADAGP